mmetsp:Transcript_36755/g.91834  ORF Transcript_36755/g.91834 Transcript_36755/m.91834 type:complete len:233 (-) Transcript_36755:638-1336(-)|eukprot:6859791-Prymnesium_polylepis.2
MPAEESTYRTGKTASDSLKPSRPSACTTGRSAVAPSTSGSSGGALALPPGCHQMRSHTRLTVGAGAPTTFLMVPSVQSQPLPTSRESYRTVAPIVPAAPIRYSIPNCVSARREIVSIRGALTTPHVPSTSTNSTAAAAAAAAVVVVAVDSATSACTAALSFGSDLVAPASSRERICAAGGGGAENASPGVQKSAVASATCETVRATTAGCTRSQRALLQLPSSWLLPTRPIF